MSKNVELRPEFGWYCHECGGHKPITICDQCYRTHELITPTRHKGGAPGEYRCWDCTVRLKRAKLGDEMVVVSEARMKRFGAFTGMRCEACATVRFPGSAPDDIDEWLRYEKAEGRKGVGRGV